MAAGKRILVLGDGKMAADSVSRAHATPGVAAAAWIHHGNAPWSAAPAARLARKQPEIPIETCDHVADSQSRAFIADFRPDLVLSVNNFDIIPGDMLGLAPDGFINFHNGPLPRYRGINIPSWAIINREPTHGAAWHRVARGVDTGAVLARTHFAVDPRETATTLTMKCITQGLELLPGLLHDYLTDNLRDAPQADSEAFTYTRQDTPDDALIDPSWPPDKLDALLRGLCFHPFPNTFILPGVRLEDGSVLRAEYGEFLSGDSGGEPGHILSASGGRLEIAANGGCVRLHEIVDTQDNAPVDPASLETLAGARVPTRHGPASATDNRD